MLYSFATAAFTFFALVLWYWKRSQARRSIRHLPGPPPGPWLVGNNPSFERPDEAGEADFEWTEKYGSAFRFKGFFGEDILHLSDPKAMQYILNTAGYNFPKTWEARMQLSLITGRGLVFVEGAQHARQRRVMSPAFSHSALKGYLPLFSKLSRRTTVAWERVIRKQDAKSSVLNVSSLLSRTTLDIIGEGAFGFKFDAIDSAEPKTELHKAYQNLFADIWYMIPDSDLIFARLLGYAPLWVCDLLTYLPKRDVQRLKNYMNVARTVAKELAEKQKQAHANGKETGKDVMSIFFKANIAENPKRRLEDDEIIPQITTLLLAGHESTANTLSWVLYELSKHPEVQRKLRDEVRAMRADVATRGESEMTISDLGSMEYMVAVVKETLRYHPIIIQIWRCAGQDDVIPLEIPQKTVTGDVITAIPVRKGQEVHLGVASYNRLKSVWGKDADEWRPERFLEAPPNAEKTSLGVYGNLATFSSGVRSCAGWHFAVIEMQTLLVELIDKFEFSPAPDVEIKCGYHRMLQSTVRGQENQGTQMPLTISILSESNGD